MTRALSLEVGTVPDRENEVAWIWMNDVQLAEVSHEDGAFQVEVYAHPTDLHWTLDLLETRSILQKAKQRLEHSPGTSTDDPVRIWRARLSTSADADGAEPTVDIWLERARFGRLCHLSGAFVLEVFPAAGQRPWKLNYGELLAILHAAQLQLRTPRSGSSEPAI